MKITKTDETNLQIIQQYQKSEGAKADAEKKVLGSAAAPEERVDLSTTARDIQKLKSAISELPETRDARVQELKAQVDKGAYKVDAEKLAEKIVGEALIDIFA